MRNVLSAGALLLALASPSFAADLPQHPVKPVEHRKGIFIVRPRPVVVVRPPVYVEPPAPVYVERPVIDVRPMCLVRILGLCIGAI